MEKIQNEKSFGSRIFELNDPKTLAYVGAFGSALIGVSAPVYGFMMSRVLALLTVPMVVIGGPDAMQA